MLKPTFEPTTVFKKALFSVMISSIESADKVSELWCDRAIRDCEISDPLAAVSPIICVRFAILPSALGARASRSVFKLMIDRRLLKSCAK